MPPPQAPPPKPRSPTQTLLRSLHPFADHVAPIIPFLDYHSLVHNVTKVLEPSLSSRAQLWPESPAGLDRSQSGPASVMPVLPRQPAQTVGGLAGFSTARPCSDCPLMFRHPPPNPAATTTFPKSQGDSVETNQGEYNGPWKAMSPSPVGAVLSPGNTTLPTTS